MNVWAYCAADWVESTRHVTGVEPVTSPPYGAASLEGELEKATAADLVYLNLHGFPHQPNFFGQEKDIVGPTALTPDAVLVHRWDGVVVFAEVCYSAAEGASRAIAKAFLGNGAAAFIGSKTEAYGRVRPVWVDGEADRLGWLFRKFYPGRGHDPAVALRAAMRLFRLLSTPLDKEDRATLKAFTYLTKENL
jgi:hypothetical protein